MGTEKYPIISNNRNIRNDIPEIDEYFKRAKDEIDNIPKVNNIVIDEKYIENIRCPVCNSESSKQFLVKEGFIYVICDQCSHLYLKNRIRSEILLELYKKSEVDKIDRKTHESDYHTDYWHRVYAKYIKILQEKNISCNELIDVGSGDGRFLRYCNDNTLFDLYGNDYCSDNYSDIIDIVGIDNYYYAQNFERINFGKKKFGVITFWGVMEHLPYPKKIFEKCYQIMTDESVVLALIPNIYSRAFRLLGVEVPTLNPRQHINFYTKNSMEYLCNVTGLKIIDAYQELPVIDLMHPYINYSEELIDEIIDANESYYFVYILGKNAN